ncbi:hypothetical protein HQQ81_14160 [Microbacteriaceae bacterium VKM Ac-2854]|nr:hypothetical protein [Microbacteriaceae bacterium VKM Ac-2854]
MLAGIAVSGTAAFAITGGAMFGALPAEETPTPIVTSTITLTPTPTPTPTSTPVAPAEPENPPAPTVRVPSTCDAVLPVAVAAELAGPTATSVPLSRAGFSPDSYAIERVGGLICRFESAPEENKNVVLTIVPLADPSAARVGSDTADPEPAISSTARSYCSGGVRCWLLDHVGSYGVQLFGWNLDDAQRESARAVMASIVAATAAFAAPAPLWEPTGATIRGALDCAGFTDDAAMSAAVGTTMVGGPPENEGNADFWRSASSVGSGSCQWISTDPSGDSPFVYASVLPGGASYFDTEASELSWFAAPDYPGDAYVSEDGRHASVLVDNGWLYVGAPADRLRAVTELILSNVAPSQ